MKSKDKTTRMKEAIAITYRKSDMAPTVVAKGKGMMADQIISKAKQHGVYVHESTELVALLTQVDIDEHIPPQLYMAVAELLAWVYKLEHNDQEFLREYEEQKLKAQKLKEQQMQEEFQEYDEYQK